MEADGAPFTPVLCQCSVLRVSKAKRLHRSEESPITRYESLKIELEWRPSAQKVASALTNCATRLFLRRSKSNFKQISRKYTAWQHLWSRIGLLILYILWITSYNKCRNFILSLLAEYHRTQLHQSYDPNSFFTAFLSSVNAKTSHL